MVSLMEAVSSAILHKRAHVFGQIETLQSISKASDIIVFYVPCLVLYLPSFIGRS